MLHVVSTWCDLFIPHSCSVSHLEVNPILHAFGPRSLHLLRTMLLLSLNKKGAQASLPHVQIKPGASWKNMDLGNWFSVWFSIDNLDTVCAWFALFCLLFLFSGMYMTDHDCLLDLQMESEGFGLLFCRKSWKVIWEIIGFWFGEEGYESG